MTVKQVSFLLDWGFS